MPSSASMTPSLSETLAPPSTATNGRLGRWRSSMQHVDLALQQPAGGARQRPWRPDDRGVGAVRGAEGVVDVAVDPVDEPGHEAVVVRLLPGVLTQVVEQLDARCQLGQPGADGCDRVLRVDGALGAAEVAGRHDVGAALLQPRQRGQRGPDAEVIGDPPPAVAVDVTIVLQRHVEVGAHEDPLAVERSELLLEVFEGGVLRWSRSPRRQLALNASGATDRRPSCRRTAGSRPSGWSSPTRCRTSRAP